jgi:hypothetical protein
MHKPDPPSALGTQDTGLRKTKSKKKTPQKKKQTNKNINKTK